MDIITKQDLKIKSLELSVASRFKTNTTNDYIKRAKEFTIFLLSEENELIDKIQNKE
jgi:hypothetical protein